MEPEPNYPRLLQSGDTALTVEFGDTVSETVNERVHAFAKKLQSHHIVGVLEVVPTYRSCLVQFNPLAVDVEELETQLLMIAEQTLTEHLSGHVVTIVPVCYGEEFGPDLEFVSRNAGLSREEVISIHSSPTYCIYMLGFTPGFPYLGGLDARIAAPRLDNPRTRIPAGSVGIAGTQTGIYPVESPGGWRLIGRTPLRLFDPSLEKPFLLSAGDYLRFRPISRLEFDLIAQQIEQGTYKVEVQTREAKT